MAKLFLPGVQSIWVGRPSNTTSGRGDLKFDSVSVLPPMLAQCAVREAGNVDGGAYRDDRTPYIIALQTPSNFYGTPSNFATHRTPKAGCT